MDTAKRIATLQRIRKLSRLLDASIGIPGTKFKFGLDPILGLIPGGGDLITGAFSTYLIIQALQLGISRQDLRKMIFNVGLETIVGTVPLAGDWFDAYYKANLRNLDILEKHLAQVNPELLDATKPQKKSKVTA